jgi:hypothetical protein
MNTNMFVLASGLTDHDLLDRIAALAGKERETSAELVAHLAALDARPSLYAAKGHGSLFSYCTRVLRLSEDAACNRIDAARASRRFPVILDGLASGALSLTTVRLLRPHLTPENHEAVLAEASGRSRQDVLELLARLAPRPDVPSSVRKLPTAPPAPVTTPAVTAATGVMQPAPASLAPPPVLTSPPSPRPVIEPTSPERYRIQFTVAKDTHDKAAAAPGPPPSRDPERRSGRHLRSGGHAAPREGRAGEDRRGEEAAAYPSRDGYEPLAAHAERVQARRLAAGRWAVRVRGLGRTALR